MKKLSVIVAQEATFRAKERIESLKQQEKDRTLREAAEKAREDARTKKLKNRLEEIFNEVLDAALDGQSHCECTSPDIPYFDELLRLGFSIKEHGLVLSRPPTVKGMQDRRQLKIAALEEAIREEKKRAVEVTKLFTKTAWEHFAPFYSSKADFVNITKNHLKTALEELELPRDESIYDLGSKNAVTTYEQYRNDMDLILDDIDNLSDRLEDCLLSDDSDENSYDEDCEDGQDDEGLEALSQPLVEGDYWYKNLDDASQLERSEFLISLKRPDNKFSIHWADSPDADICKNLLSGPGIKWLQGPRGERMLDKVERAVDLASSRGESFCVLSVKQAEKDSWLLSSGREPLSNHRLSVAGSVPCCPPGELSKILICRGFQVRVEGGPKDGKKITITW